MRKHQRGSDTKAASVAFKSMVCLIYCLQLLLPRANTYGFIPTGQTLSPGLPGDSLMDPRHLVLPERNFRDEETDAERALLPSTLRTVSHSRMLERLPG